MNNQEAVTRQNLASLLQVPLQRFLDKDPNFKVNKLAAILEHTDVDYDPDTWVSVTRRGSDDKSSIVVGLQPWPEELVERWSVGSTNTNEQILFRLAHELSHAYQKERGYEAALVKFLDGDNDIPEQHIPYVELYVLLSGIGTVNGLTTAAIYEQQSRTTGNLKMETLEDITELIAAYLISDEYFLYRLENSVTVLDVVTKEDLAKKVIEICRELH